MNVNVQNALNTMTPTALSPLAHLASQKRRENVSVSDVYTVVQPHIVPCKVPSGPLNSKACYSFTVLNRSSNVEGCA